MDANGELKGHRQLEMEYMKMAIVTEDRAYGEALARALLIGNRNFDLALYECGDFCRRWRDMGPGFPGGFDMILWDSEGMERLYGGNIIWLTEHMSQTTAMPGKEQPFPAQEVTERLEQPKATAQKRFAVYKYSCGEAMVAAVFGIYERLTGRKAGGVRPQRVDVFAFASWQGGCGCTTLAMAMGQELARFYRRRVLYLSLEGVESTPIYMKAPEGMKHMGEYLYHLMADPGAPFLEEYLIHDGFGTQAFAPAGSCNPLSIAEPKALSRVLSALMASGRFDVILIDAGNASGAQVTEALGYADRICLVSAREEPGREERYRTFLEASAEYGADGASRRSTRPEIIRVCNRCEAPPRARTGEVLACVCEGERGAAALNLEGRFGKDIHQLTELCYNGVATANAES